MENWNSGVTMSAVAIDLHYHAVWLLVQRVVETNGIEEDEAQVGGVQGVAELRKNCADEAEHSALRITALVRQSDGVRSQG